MDDPYGLRRFVDAQKSEFAPALAELRAGAKHSHWMWFIFPQLTSLGRSATAKYYGINSLDEARAYLAHPILGPRLRQSVEMLIPWAGTRSAEQILGAVDAMKLRSSLTLFDLASPADVYAKALDAFFGGEPDQRTLALMGSAR